jgi:hypothetical protein
MGAMGALAPAILKNRLLAPAVFGHLVLQEKLRVLNKNRNSPPTISKS